MVERIRIFREQLLANGFVHANAAGEVKSDDGTVWVGTTFTHGEIRVYMWQRPKGYGNPVGNSYILVHASTPIIALESLASWLIDCAETAPADRDWPYPESLTV